MLHLVLRHFEGGAGGRDHVLLDHDRTHVVGAELECELTDLLALRHPAGLQVLHIIQEEPRHRERRQVLMGERFGHVLHFGVVVLEGPRDKRREATGFILQVSNALQVLDSSLQSLAHAVHHGGRSPEIVPVRLAHDVEPLVRRGLAVGENVFANAIDENLGTAARNRLQTGVFQACDHVIETHPLELGDKLDLRRRERMQVDLRVLAFQVPEQILVVGERQVRMHTALHENAGAVERQGLFDLLADLLERQKVSFLVARFAIERAKSAPVDADVGVVDVAIDVVARGVRIVEAVAHFFGSQTEVDQITVQEQLVGVTRRDTATADSIVDYGCNGPAGGSVAHEIATLWNLSTCGKDGAALPTTPSALGGQA